MQSLRRMKELSKPDKERQISCITCKWNLKQDTNKLIYKTEVDSQTCGCQCGGMERRTGSLGLLHLERINNKILLYSTGNYIQSPGINHNGKEYKIRMFICL